MLIVGLVTAVVVTLPDPLETEVAAVADEDRQLDAVLAKQHQESDRDDANFNQWAASVATDLGDVYGKSAQPRMEPNLRTDAAHPGSGGARLQPEAKPAKPSSLLQKDPEGADLEPDALGVGSVPGFNGIAVPAFTPGASWANPMEKAKAMHDQMAADEENFKERLEDDETEAQAKYESHDEKISAVLKRIAAIDTSMPGAPSSLLEDGELGTSPLDLALAKLRADDAPIERDALTPVSMADDAPLGQTGVSTFAQDDARLTAQLQRVAQSEDDYAQKTLGISDTSNEAPIGRFNEPFSFVQIAEVLHDQGLTPDDSMSKVEAKLQEIRARLKHKYAKDAKASSFAELSPQLSDGFDKLEEKLQALRDRMEANEQLVGKDAKQADAFAKRDKAEFAHAHPSSFAQVRPSHDDIKRSFAKVSEQLSALRAQIHGSTVEDEKEDAADKQELGALEKRHKASLAESFAEVDDPTFADLGPGPTFAPPKLNSVDQQALDKLQARLAHDQQVEDDERQGKFDLAPSSFAQISPELRKKEYERRRLEAEHHEEKAYEAQKAAGDDLTTEAALHDELDAMRQKLDAPNDAGNRTLLQGLNADIAAELKEEKADNAAMAKQVSAMSAADPEPVTAETVEQRTLDKFAASLAKEQPALAKLPVSVKHAAKAASFAQTGFHSIIPQIEHLSMGCMHKCNDAVMNCVAAGKTCAQHLACLQKSNFADPEPCLKDVDEDKLTPHETRLYECATKDHCMPASSFLERLVDAAAGGPGPIGPELFEDLNEKMAALSKRMELEQKKFGTYDPKYDPPADAKESSLAETSDSPWDIKHIFQRDSNQNLRSKLRSEGDEGDDEEDIEADDTSDGEPGLSASEMEPDGTEDNGALPDPEAEPGASFAEVAPKHKSHKKKHHKHKKHGKHGKHGTHGEDKKKPASSWGDAELDEKEAEYKEKEKHFKTIADLKREKDEQQAKILQGLVDRHKQMESRAERAAKERDDELLQDEFPDESPETKARREWKAKTQQPAGRALDQDEGASSFLETGEAEGQSALESQLLALQARMEANSRDIEEQTAQMKMASKKQNEAEEEVSLGPNATNVERLALKQAQALRDMLFNDANQFRSGAEKFAEQVVKESERLYPQLRDHINPVKAKAPSSLLQTSGQTDAGSERKVFDSVVAKLNAVAQNMRDVKEKVEMGKNKIEREQRELDIHDTASSFLETDSTPTSLAQTGASSTATSGSAAQMQVQAKMAAKLKDLHQRATSLLEDTESSRILKDGWGDDDPDASDQKAPPMPWQRTIDELIPHVEAEEEELKQKAMYNAGGDVLQGLKAEDDKVHDTLLRLKSASYDPSVMSQSAESDEERHRVLEKTQSLKDKLAADLKRMDTEFEGDSPAIPSSLLQQKDAPDESSLDAAIARGRRAADKNFRAMDNPGQDVAIAKEDVALAGGAVDGGVAQDGFDVDAPQLHLESIYKMPDFGMRMLSDADPLLQVKDAATLDKENQLMGGIQTTAQLAKLKDMFTPGHSPIQMPGEIPDVRTEIDAAMAKIKPPTSTDSNFAADFASATSEPRLMTDLGLDPDVAVEGLGP